MPALATDDVGDMRPVMSAWRLFNQNGPYIFYGFEDNPIIKIGNEAYALITRNISLKG